MLLESRLNQVLFVHPLRAVLAVFDSRFAMQEDPPAQAWSRAPAEWSPRGFEWGKEKNQMARRTWPLFYSQRTVSARKRECAWHTKARRVEEPTT